MLGDISLNVNPFFIYRWAASRQQLTRDDKV